MHPLRAAGVVLLLAAAFVPAARSDDFADFRIPSHRVLSWTGLLEGSASHSGRDYNDDAFRARNLGGRVGTSVFWLGDSDPVYTSVASGLLLEGGRFGSDESQSNESPLFGSQSRVESRSERSVAERWDVAAQHRRYPFELPVGVELDLSFFATDRQSWRETEGEDRRLGPGLNARQRWESFEERWDYLVRVVAGAGLGYGRVRDATGVYEARALEERLVEAGALERPLGAAGRRRLAELLYRRGDYSVVRERPALSVWDEIEAILLEDGALAAEGIGRGALLRAMEPYFGPTGGTAADGLPRSPLLRLRGTWIAAVFQNRHVGQTFRIDAGNFFETVIDDTLSDSSRASFGQRWRMHDDDVTAGLRAEYHRPLGMRWQLDGESAVTVPTERRRQWLFVSNRLGVGWILADRWLGSAEARYSWTDEVRTQGPTPGDHSDASAGLSLSYYLQDRTAVTLSASERQTWIRGGTDPAAYGHEITRGGDVRLSLTHHFQNRLAASGLGSAAGP